MNAIIGLSLATLALQLGAVLTASTIARAPGWQRVRIIAYLAASAGAYSIVRLLGEALPDPARAIPVLTAANIVVAAIHLSTWLWYGFSNAQGDWSSLPLSVRRFGVGVVGFCAAAALTGNLVSDAALVTTSVPWLGVTFAHARLSLIGLVSASLVMSLLVLSLVEQARQARRGIPGARAILAGFVLFAICGAEEIGVAAGWIHFIYIGEIGYLGLVVPVTIQLLRRFRQEAGRLAELSVRLSAEFQDAEHERDLARESFVAQERFAALGRIASGVGHEINNPLQYLSLNLEELREHRLLASSSEAQEALDQSFDAADRIRRIVDGMRAYARSTVPQLAPIDPRAVVRAALKQAGPQLGQVDTVDERLGPVPHVLGDEEKLVQAVLNAVLNASSALERDASRASVLQVRTYTAPDGHAAIEVRDNGPGFPKDLLPSLGEPFVTTRATDGGSGLGLFVVRGIVDAHGGSLELENARGGGAVLRVLLPPAAQPA